MYYNSNKNSNDYYNSYKKELAELESYKKEENIQKIIKLILSLLALLLLTVAIFYLYKYFNPTPNNLIATNSSLKPQQLPNIIIREEELPQSIQVYESNIKIAENLSQNPQVVSSINEQDIALIVQIIMSQINAKIEKPLEEQLQNINNKTFVNKRLEKMNHYNKIILTKNELSQVKNSSLMELSNNLNNIINEENNINSNYMQEIKKEVRFRKNEMRIIIVQKGDTLSKIAKKAYGTYDDYSKIFTANPEIIKNPNQIFIGQRLRIPS